MKPTRRYGKTTSISGLLFMGLLFSLVLFGCADDDHDALTTTTTTIVIPGTTTTTVPADALQTVRDEKGVWFIEGPEDAALFDVYEQMGYTVAHDRLWQMETYRRAAAGRLSEIFGESQLETDIFMRIIGYSEAELSAGFAALDAETKQIVEGYIAGVNRAVEAVRNNVLSIPFEFAALDILPEYWRPEEVLAVAAFFLRRFDPEALNSRQLDNLGLFQALNARFGAAAPAMFADLRRRNDPDAQTYIPAAGRRKRRSVPLDPPAADLPDYGPLAAGVGGVLKRVNENLKAAGAAVKMGSYAWALSGGKTDTGNPMLYSGPQMGFDVPSIVAEGSIRAGGLNISGMTVPVLPGLLVARTPHHAWSMQVGHAHTTDYYLETPEAAALHRLETIRVKGAEDVTIPVFRTAHGPVINPIPFDPATYVPDPENPVVAWRYSHTGHEFDTIGAYLDLARAAGIDEFGEALAEVAVSQHYCYIDVDGNIAYWMSGFDPERPLDPFDYLLPQGVTGLTAPPAEWGAGRRPLPHDRNPVRGWYGGWNNKASVDYPNAPNNGSYYFGPFHRAHVIAEALSAPGPFSFEAVRDLALSIAVTDSLGFGGNPYAFVEDIFTAAVESAGPTSDRNAALTLLAGWDGRFVAGGPSAWPAGTDLADAWVLSDAWIREVIRLTFADEFAAAGIEITPLETFNLFQVLVHALTPDSALSPNYNWFENIADPAAPQTAEGIIVQALDGVLVSLGEPPWGIGMRGEIEFNHDMFNDPPVDLNPLHTIPFSSRSTYGQCVEMGPRGPVRIQSMFPLGESGRILVSPARQPVFHRHFYSMTGVYDTFAHRDFPLFDERP